MDDRRFDDLTKTLTALAPRRAVVRLLKTGTLAGFAATLTGLVGRHDAEAGKGRKKRRKKKKPCTQNCAGKVCGDDDGCGGKCTTQQGCGANQTCVGGVCVTDSGCATGTELCGGVCVDLQSDPENCGFCRRPVCGPPEDPACAGWECCNGAPTFTRGCLNGSGGWVECQKPHCGSCGNPCDVEGRGCCEGQCVPMSDGLEANGNCGYCGTNCGDPLTCCGGRCVNTDNDPLNCGDCGEVCDGTHACCHGECKRLGTPENCLGCDDECEADQVCVNSFVGCVKP